MLKYRRGGYASNGLIILSLISLDTTKVLNQNLEFKRKIFTSRLPETSILNLFYKQIQANTNTK